MSRERNKRIKQVLSKEFGYKNVRVRGGRGTSYGWVYITITAPKPHQGECKKPEGWGDRFYECEDCRRVRESTKQRVWEILKENGILNELGIWYSDDPYATKNYECAITVRLEEGINLPESTPTTEGEDYRVVHEGNWTWIYFSEKPSEEVRAKLKEKGFRFSKKRLAWYIPKKVQVPLAEA